MTPHNPAENVMDNVSITPEAADEWHRIAAEVAANSPRLTMEDIGEETAHAMPDGTLEIRCQFMGEMVRMTVPVGQWTWAN